MKQLVLACGLALASCSPMAAPLDPALGRPAGEPIRAACPVAGPGDWAAWVNAMPGPNARPTLIVTGKVTVPTGGYRIAIADMRVMESYPVQVAADLLVVPPAGGATQAVVTHDVRGQWPISPPVGSVTISCGGRVLTRIAPVETAQ
jgi:hypothetical protein